MSALRSTSLHLALLVLSVTACQSPALPSGSFERRMAAAVSGHSYRYRLDVPAAEARPQAGWPLLLFLHGAGERGDDLAQVAVHGPPKLVDQIPALGRCVLVSPQCPSDAWWRADALAELLAEVLARLDVDRSRVYVTGLSMGGYGTWGLLAHDPQLVAAAVPICGGGDIARLWPEIPSDFVLADLLRARDVPLHAFHGADDDVIPVEESRRLVEALQAAGADARLTVYPDTGHDSWTRTYADPDLYAWMFAQRRAAPAVR